MVKAAPSSRTSAGTGIYRKNRTAERRLGAAMPESEEFYMRVSHFRRLYETEDGHRGHIAMRSAPKIVCQST